MNSLFERAKSIILNPSETWTKIKQEDTSIGKLYTSYASVLALIPALAQFIGYSIIGYSFMGTHFRLSIGSSIGNAIVSYVLTLAGLFVIAYIADAIAPNFNSTKNLTNAFKAITYSMTPLWIAGIFYIIPQLSVLAILAGLYGLYLFYLGLPLLMDTPKEKALGYVIVVVVVTVVIYLIIGAIAGALFSINPMVGTY